MNLSDVLPWGTQLPSNRTILINDTVEITGKFILYYMALQYLSFPKTSLLDTFNNNVNVTNNTNDKEPRVLWISCTTRTREEIINGLKNLKCDTAYQLLKEKNDATNRLYIVSILHEISEHYFETNNDPHYHENYFENYCCSIYTKIKNYSKKSPTLVILDDISSFSTFLGTPLTVTFLYSLQSLLNHQTCITIVSSHDMIQKSFYKELSECRRNISVTGGKPCKWIGCGSVPDNATKYDIWEQMIPELSDGIIDVIPLPSGFHREIQGRLIFTERKGGKGWCNGCKDRKNGSVYNFECKDFSVKVMKVETG